MRIIAGEWRGRKLEVPDGIRPMLDRERERLFAILGPRIEGAHAVENGHRVLPVLRRNVSRFDTGDRHRVIPLSAFRVADLPSRDPFDIALAAPPFPLLRDPDWQERCHSLFRGIVHELLIPGGIFVLEMPADLDPEEVSGLGPAEDRRRTAASVIAFWTRPAADPVSG